MAGRNSDDDLAYGQYHGQGGEESDRGFLGDAFNRFAGRRPQQQGVTNNASQPQNPQSSTTSSSMSFFDKLHSGVKNPQAKRREKGVHKLGSELKTRIATGDVHSHTHDAAECHPGAHDAHRDHRYLSFAPERPQGNGVKWYVDGCGYMWAISKAIQSAKESIWILDWWLSPELYLRRPPAKNEQYRLDNMLKAAAERGVKINVIVYKEVTQALTRKYLNPSVPDYLHSLLPPSTDLVTATMAKLGLQAIFKSLEQWEMDAPLIEPPVTVSSAHTKHHLEEMHPNIVVLRHPDHLPDRNNMAQDFVTGLQNLKLSAASLAQMPGNALGALYGSTGDSVLFWAHHEKLCLIDGHTAFMGGLDLCYGRWDTNQHAIADAHPGDLTRIVFPGQDYNNSRIMDFHQVDHPDQNKLDRTQHSRMGWSDISICLSGPVTQDLKQHFVERWNLIYEEKYRVRKDDRYSLLSISPASLAPGQAYGQQPPSPGYGQGVPQFDPPPTQTRGFDDDFEGERGLGGREGGFRDSLKHRVQEGYQQFDKSRYGQQMHEYAGRYGLGSHRPTTPGGSYVGPGTGASVQLCRSASKWSHGVPVEHSIATAYINVIRDSKQFIYCENQFWITATGEKQAPIRNQIGAAIVERITRAARSGEKWKMIVVIPAIPAFAGDLRLDEALSTRCILEFQYFSISRGGYSIYEQISRAGFNPVDWIRFYNLRSYDRINSSAAMAEAEKTSGVQYEDARKQFDEKVGGGFVGSRGLDKSENRALYPGQEQYGQPQPASEQAPTQSYQAYHPPGSVSAARVCSMKATSNISRIPPPPPQQYPAELSGSTSYPPPPAGAPPGQQHEGYGERPQYQGQNPLAEYQQAAQKVSGPLASGRWDSVAECYMLGGEDIRNVPWEGTPEAEIDAFVSEELYVHSKLLIADDRVVICGSANLNDRSQLGDHDSEIAVVIEDHNLIDSSMNGQPWKATKFAATLRRHIFKKHLGLLPPQDYEKEEANYLPVGVPNEYEFGTEEDRLVADPLDDNFLNFWNSRAHTNTEVFGKVFHPVPHDSVLTWQDYDEWYSKHFREADKKDPNKPAGKYKVGHVVAEDFPGGVQQVKEELSKIKGTLVEMPLLFLKKEDIAQEGLGLNAFTEEVYT